MRDLDVNAGAGGAEQLTIAAGPTSVAGSDQQCTEVIVSNLVGNNVAYINIGAAATTSHFELAAGEHIDVAVLNTNQINVIGTAGEKVSLLWRK